MFSIKTMDDFKYLSKENIRNENHLAVKNMLHLLDFDLYTRLPSYHSTGFERLTDNWLIYVHNLPELAYLNLTQSWYIPLIKQDLQHTYNYKNNCSFKHRSILDMLIHSIENKLVNYIKSAVNSDPKSWIFINSIFNAIRSPAQLYLELIVSEDNFLKVFFNIFYEYHRNRNLNVDQLDVFCAWEFVQFTELYKLEYFFEKCNESKFDVHKALCFSEKHIDLETHDYWIQFCPVIEARLEGRYAHLGIFFNYGFQREEISVDVRNSLYSQYFENLNETEGRTIIELPEAGENYTYGIHRLYLLLEMVYNLYIFTIILNKDSTVHRCTNATILLSLVHSEYLIFRSIPDPLISFNELHTLLHTCDFFTENLEIIRFVFEEHFPEIVAITHEPRTLYHLCRCAVRSILRNNFQMPGGIHKLGLPSKIVSFLELCC